MSGHGRVGTAPRAARYRVVNRVAYPALVPVTVMLRMEAWNGRTRNG
jgi:hypothetical protein